MQVAYHLSLSRFLLRSLADLYPELPVGGFSGLAVFSVKDEVGVWICFSPVFVFCFFLPQKIVEHPRSEVSVGSPSVLDNLNQGRAV